MYKAVIFDLDGTLLDTLHDLAVSINHVFEHYGKEPVSNKEVKLLVGRGADQLLKDAFPTFNDAKIQEARAVFEAHYAKQYDKNTKAYDGINKLLTFLHVRGVKLAVLSNKPNSFTKKSVLKYLRSWKFEEVFGIREGVPRKPDPAAVHEILESMSIKPEEALFVGDTNVDMQTATRAGITPIGVLWGFREKEELLESGAKYIVKTPIELMRLLVTMEIVERKNS